MRYLFLFLLGFTHLLHAQSPRILLDEAYDDWQNIPVLVNDPSGDQGSSTVDFGKLWINNDEDFLFFRLEVGSEINLQDGNDIKLYIDTDNNSSTGLSISGIGADLFYHFGGRTGEVYLNGNSLTINHSDIFLVSSPTVTSDQFEIAINRDLQFQGQFLFKGNDIKVLFKNDIAGADQIPNAAGGVMYSFQSLSPDPLPAYSIDKLDSSHIRVLSYNVLRDNLFAQDKQVYYSRILQAISPDIIGFQEIYQNGSS